MGTCLLVSEPPLPILGILLGSKVVTRLLLAGCCTKARVVSPTDTIPPSLQMFANLSVRICFSKGSGSNRTSLAASMREVGDDSTMFITYYAHCPVED